MSSAGAGVGVSRGPWCLSGGTLEPDRGLSCFSHHLLAEIQIITCVLMWVVVLICGRSHESLPLLMALLISSKMWRRRRLIKETYSFDGLLKRPESGLNIYSLLWSCRRPVPAALSLLCLSTLYLCAAEAILNYQLDTTDCLPCRFLILLHHFYFSLSSYLLKYLWFFIYFSLRTSAAATPESPSGD